MELETAKNYRSRWLHIAILCIVTIVAYGYTFDSKLALLGDNASYYMLGKSISLGEGYVNISKITKSPNNHYPPGYPAIISVVMLFTDNIVAVKVLNGLFLIGSLVLAYLLISRLVQNHVIGLVITLLSALSSHLLFYGSLMMSEVPYMFFSLLTIYLVTSKSIAHLKPHSKAFIAALISLVIAYYVRSLGVALLGGMGLYFIIERKWMHTAVSFLALIVGGLPWFIRGQSLGGASYINQLKLINPYNPSLGDASISDFIARIWSNFSRYITREIPDAMFGFGPNYHEPISGKEWLVGMALSALIIYGILKLPRFKWLIFGYLLSTFGILMIWPEVWIGVRFIVPVIVFLWLGAGNGFYCLFVLLRKQKEPSIVVTWAPLVLLVFLIRPIIELHENAIRPYPPAWQRYFEVADWLKNNEDGAVVSCGKPSLFYTFADNYTMRYKFTRNTEELIADLEKKKVNYVVIDQVYGNTFQYLLPAVRQNPHRFKQVLHLKNPDTFLLKFE